MNVSPDIEESWKVVLQNEFEKKYIKNLKQFLTNEKERYQIFPKGTEIFNAFNSTPFHKLKVVISKFQCALL